MLREILIGMPVNEDIDILETVIKALNNLYLSDSKGIYYDISCMFVLHNDENGIMRDLIREKTIYTSHIVDYNNKTKYKKDEYTHHWSEDNFEDVVNMKNRILKYARDNVFDYLFLLDSDIIINKNTLCDLIKFDKDMISNIFWTKWNKELDEQPNFWDADSYAFHPKKIELLQTKKLSSGDEIIKVGGTGACTLLKSIIFKNELINFTQLSNVSFSRWEDRAFCIKATVFNHDIYTYIKEPVIHLYRKSDLIKYKNGGM